MERVDDNVRAVEEAKAKMRAARFLTQTDLDWRKKMIDMQNDPEFAKKYGEDGSGFSGAVKQGFEQFAQDAIDKADPQQKKYIEDGMYNLGSSMLASSAEYEAKVGSAFAVDTISQGIANGRQSANLSPEQAGSILQNVHAVISAAPHIDAATRIKLQTEADKEVATGIALGALRKNGDAAARAIIKGSLTFDMVENGKHVTKNISQLMDGEAYQTLIGQSERVIKEGDAATSENVKNVFSDLSLEIQKAESPDDIVNLTDSINKNEAIVGHVKANDLRSKLQGKIEGQAKELDSIGQGSAFASGDAYINPANTKQVEDYNKYFNKRVLPNLENADSDTRNTFLVSLIDRTKVIPKAIAGDIKATARSTSAKQIATAADFIDRLGQTNPHMLQDFDQGDLMRINLVNGFLTTGYNAKEAVTLADAKLDTSDATVKQREGELVANKLDYKSKATNLFTSIFRSEDTSSNVATRQIDQLATDYRRAYDSVYLGTGDTALAEKQASQVVSGMYGVTDINGKNQIMRFAPEKYYAIEGQDNAWMRKQFVEEANTALGSSMVAPGTTVDKNVFLVPDPKVTPRTAKQGQPAYKMMLKTQNGELVPLLGDNQYFYFDPDKRRQELIDEAKKLKNENPLNNIPTGPGIR